MELEPVLRLSQELVKADKKTSYLETQTQHPVWIQGQWLRNCAHFTDAVSLQLMISPWCLTASFQVGIYPAFERRLLPPLLRKGSDILGKCLIAVSRKDNIW